MFGWGKSSDASRRSGYLMGGPEGTVPSAVAPAKPVVSREVLPLIEPAVQALPPVAQTAPMVRKGLGARQAVALGLACLFAVFAIEASLSGTALITPIDARFLQWMRAFGVVMGFCLWGMLMLATGNMAGQSKAAIVGLVLMPLAGGWAFNGIAWRLEDMREFGFSVAPFEAAQYPIKWTSSGRKGRRDVLQIDPYGVGNTNIPVPTAQYQAVWSGTFGQCVVVSQRRSASGAIEIRTDGQFTLFEPAPVRVVPCEGEELGVTVP